MTWYRKRPQLSISVNPSGKQRTMLSQRQGPAQFCVWIESCQWIMCGNYDSSPKWAKQESRSKATESTNKHFGEYENSQKRRQDFLTRSLTAPMLEGVTISE